MEMFRAFFRKIERTATSLFMPVENCRDGECRNCGACCRMPYDCPFLKRRDGEAYFCAVYTLRPPQCRKYPRSRNEWETEGHCGYCFREK